MKTLRTLLATASTLVLLAACSSGSTATPEAEYTPTPAADLPADGAPLADGSTVPVGDWGVVRYLSTDDEETLVAIRMTDLVVGEPGELAEVTAFGVEDLDEATPYFVSYAWANMSGDAAFSPSQRLVATGPADVATLSVPGSLERCDPPAVMEYGSPLGYEMHGCAVIVSVTGAPEALVFQGPEGSSVDVSFEAPRSSQ